MWQKIGIYIIIFVLASLVSLMQFSLFSSWPSFWGSLDLVAIIAIFCLFFLKFPLALAFASVSALWLDLLGFNFFGFHFLCFSLTLIVAEKMLSAWLTNRSLYSFILLMIASIFLNNFFSSWLAVFEGTSTALFLFESVFWLKFFYQAAWSLVFSITMFSVANFLSKRFQPFFLEGHWHK